MNSTAQTPIFVVGCPRSGTSVMSWTIAQHPAFVTGPESHFLFYLCTPQRDPKTRDGSHLHDSYKRSLTGDSWLDSRQVNFKEFAAAIGNGIKELFADHSQGRIWVDSSPEYVLVIDALVALFPQTKIIHMVRDARAVCKSMLHSGFPVPWANSLDRACETWRHFVEVGLEAEKRNGSSIIRVQQEQLASDPNATTQRIFDFLGVERPQAALEFLQGGPVNSSYDRASQLGIKAPRPKSPSPTASVPKDKPESIWKPGMEIEVENNCRKLLTELAYLPRSSAA